MRTRWRAGLVPVALMAAAALALPGASSAGSAGLVPVPAGTRAMWVWSDAPAADVVSWAAGHGVSEIFVSVSASVLTNGDLARLQDIRRRAVAARIRMTALGGDPAWTTDYAPALAWQKAVVTTGLFDGIHLDVEPYLLPAWSANLAGAEAAYLKLLERMRAGSTLRLEADVPFWYGQYRTGTANFADEVLKRVDGITVMSYRNSGTGPNSIIAVSQDWLARGAAAGKRVRLGAETGSLPDCGYCTFAGTSNTTLQLELAKVDTSTRTAAAFGGIAIHWYATWRTLRP